LKIELLASPDGLIQLTWTMLPGLLLSFVHLHT
jgi:hypothetical protein